MLSLVKLTCANPQVYYYGSREEFSLRTTRSLCSSLHHVIPLHISTLISSLSFPLLIYWPSCSSPLQSSGPLSRYSYISEMLFLRSLHDWLFLIWISAYTSSSSESHSLTLPSQAKQPSHKFIASSPQVSGFLALIQQIHLNENFAPDSRLCSIIHVFIDLFICLFI